MELSDTLVEQYKKYPNDLNNISLMTFNTLDKKIIFDLYISKWCINRYGYRNDYMDKFYNLINTYNYKLQSLLTYIDNLMTYEALDNFTSIISELHDYVTMMARISPKYEKYPKNFLTTHKIACRNYNRLKETFEELDFQRRIDKSLEHTYEDYKFIYPKSTQNIKDEAVQQNNCVASYIKRVINGECHILFMRKKDALDKSLVTIEVIDNKIVQARGKFNRDVTAQEQEAIDNFNKIKGKKERKEEIAC